MGVFEDLKYVGFVRLVEVKFLAIFSNIYGFFKDNSSSLKETVDSVETKVLSIMEPATKMIDTLCEYKLGFIDEKLDKYAPTFIKDLFGKLNSYIEKKISRIEEVFGLLVQKAKSLIQKEVIIIETTIQQIIIVELTAIQKVISVEKSVVGGIPIIGGAAQSFITKELDMASHLIENSTSSINEYGIFGALSVATEYVVEETQSTSTSIIQKGSETISQVVDTTTSIVGGIPIIGDAAQSIITTQTDMASKLIETTTSSIKENGIFGFISSVSEHVVNEVQETGASIIQKGSETIGQALDTTTSIVGGIPIIGDAAQSIITTQTNMASQFVSTTTSSINENGIFGTITSAAENAVKEAQATGASIIQKGSETASQALDTTTSVIGGIPIIGGAAQSIITTQTDMASQLISSTTSSYKESGMVGALSSAAEQVVNGAQATGASIIQKGTESASQVLDSTKSVVGGIPIIGGAAESIITKQTDMASQLISTTTSSVKENGIFGAISDLTDQVVKEAQATAESIIQKSSDSAKQALETTKSVVGSIPIVGETAQSIITDQADRAIEVIEKSTSSVKKHGLLGSLMTAVGEVGNTAKTVIEKGAESVNKTIEKTKETKKKLFFF